ncbi:MAG: diphthine synthase [Sulfolobus sp.]
MGTLKLVGLGLSLKYLTPKALEELKNSDIVYLDSYTSVSCDISEEKLREKGINVTAVDRNFIENNTKKIIGDLNNGKIVSIASIGDPVIATTHVSLLVEAKNKGHEVKVIPGVSVHCYIISKSLLSSYKFGKSVTITYPINGKIDITPYNVLKENLERGLHTIFYLDIRDGKLMTAREAIELLLEMEKLEKGNIVNKDSLVVVGERLGCEDEEVVSLTVEEALNYKFIQPPHIIVFPSKSLHFMELEGLKCLRQSRKE